MPTIGDKLGALFLVAAAFEGEVTVTLSNGYYIVTFGGTTANLMFDAAETTEEEIREVIREARS